MYLSTVLILLLTVLDILVYYLHKLQEQDNGGRKKSLSLDKRSMHAEDHGERRDSSLSSPSSSTSMHGHCRVFSLDEIKLATNDFDDAFVIGKGGFGKVYKGKVDFGSSIDVAIKRSNPDSDQGATEFRTEIKMLSKFRHSHIVSLLGYCEKEMILVYEYMPNGSLEDHLHKKRANSSPLTWVQRLNICIGAARGLDYLHTGTGVQHRVIHRDVKSSNILLDENLAGKIADFGLSRITPAPQSGATTNVHTRRIIGTFGYMDAEYFSTNRLTRKSDVYAFGVVLLEVLCGRPALDFTLDEQQHNLAGWAKHCIERGNISRIIDSSLRGQVSAKCLKKFGQIAYECIYTCSKDRPTMTMVLARLELVLTWTIQSVKRISSRKHIAWSLFLTKVSRHVISDMKKGGNDNGGVEPFQHIVPPSGETMPLHLKKFTYSELQIATMNFKHDRLLGVGGFGSVYKGWLDKITYSPQKGNDDIPVAIKVLNSKSGQGLREWQAEVNFSGKFHPNIVKVLGYCRENKKLLIVYEFMPKGSINDHLFGKNRKRPSWSTRIKMAIGAAQGLAFLHNTENNVIFRDVKTSNILLDTDFNAKISDLGLAMLGPANGESHVSTCVMGTYGYAAPEYLATGRIYIKSDVYGFGVVMLEIITGLPGLDKRRNSIIHNLVDWARPFLSDKKMIQGVMDPHLQQFYPLKAACKTAKLILTCLEPEPGNRPSMEEVVSCLKDINAIKMKPEQVNS